MVGIAETYVEASSGCVDSGKLKIVNFGSWAGPYIVEEGGLVEVHLLHICEHLDILMILCCLD